MIRYIFLLFSIPLLAGFGLNKSQLKENIVNWSLTKKLTWDNFQGKVDTSSAYKAMTFVTINYKEYTIYSDSVVFYMPCQFIKNQSWSKSKNNLSLLKHEQLHFDIAELVTRKIRRDLQKYKSTSLDEMSKFLDSINKKYFIKEYDYVSEKYDAETNHSIIEKKQKEWEIKIANELKALDKYANTKVVVKRVKK